MPQNEFLDYSMMTKDKLFLKFSDEIFNQCGIGGNLTEYKKEFLVKLLLNLKHNYGTNTYVNVPLRKKYYADYPSKYRTNLHGYVITKQVVEGLYRNGYIILVKGDNETKITSACHASAKLIKLLDNFPKSIYDREKPQSFVILRELTEVIKYKRGKKKIYRELDYDDPEALRINEEIKAYADLRNNCHLSLRGIPEADFNLCKDILEPVSSDYVYRLVPDEYRRYNVNLIKTFPVRIFNNDFQHGGRFYRGIETELKQRIKVKDGKVKVKLRQYLHINGIPTTELDYNAMHPRMLYHMEGIDYREDPYTIGRNCSDDIRNIYKLVGMICINSEDEKAAIDGIQETLLKADLTKYLPDNTDDTRKKLIKSFARHNKPIEKYFFSGIGLELQMKDSDIAHSILRYFAGKGILVLPVHDSFIIDNFFRSDLKKAMQEFYLEKMGFKPKIK